MTRDLTKPILQASAPPAAIVGGLDLGASQKAIDVKPGQNGLPDATLQKSATKAFSKFREELGSGGQNALGQALDGNSTPERSVQAQVLVDQVVERARRDGGMPKVVSAVSVGDVTAAGGPATALPKGVDAAYIPSKNVILVRQGLSGPALQAALAEEFGEWLGALAAKAGVTLAPGDVGARIRAVLAGLTPAPGTFSEAADDGTKVRLNGQVLTARAMAQGFDGTLAFESSDHLWLEYKKGNNWVQIGAQKSAQNTPLGQQAPVVRQKGIAVPADVVPGKTLFRLRLKPLNGDPVITVATNDPGVYGANSTFTQSTSPNGTFRLSLNAWGNGDIARPLLANGQRGPKPDWLILDAAPDSDLTLVLQPKTPVQAPAASNTPSTVSAMVEFGSGNTELRALNPVTQKFDYIANSTAGQNVRRIVTIPRLGKNLPVLRLQEGNKYFYSNKGGSTFTTSAGGNPVIRFETDVKTNAQADAGGFDDLTVTIGPKTLPAAQSVRKAVSAKAVQDALGAVNVAADIASLLPADRGLATFGGDSVATPQTIVTGPQKLFVAKEHRAMVSVVLDAAGFRTYDWLEVQTADGSWKQIASEQPITRDFNRRIFNFVYDRRRGVPKLRFVNKKDKPIEVDPQNNNKNGTGAWKDLGTKPYSSGTNKRTLEFNSAIKVDIITKAAPKYGEGVLIHVDEVPSLGPRQNGSRSNLQYLNANNQWIDFAKSAFGERNWDVGVPIELPLVNGKPPLVRMAQQIVQGSIFNNAQSQNWTYSAPQQLRIDSTSDMFQMVSPLPDKSKDEKYYPYNVPGVAPGNSNRFSLRATSYTFQNGETKPQVIQQPQASGNVTLGERLVAGSKTGTLAPAGIEGAFNKLGMKFTPSRHLINAGTAARFLGGLNGGKLTKQDLDDLIRNDVIKANASTWTINLSAIPKDRIARGLSTLFGSPNSLLSSSDAYHVLAALNGGSSIDLADFDTLSRFEIIQRLEDGTWAFSSQGINTHAAAKIALQVSTSKLLTPEAKDKLLRKLTGSGLVTLSNALERAKANNEDPKTIFGPIKELGKHLFSIKSSADTATGTNLNPSNRQIVTGLAIAAYTIGTLFLAYKLRSFSKRLRQDTALEKAIIGIPSLVSIPGTPDKYLPPGRYQATLSDVEKRFAVNSRRRQQFENIRKVSSLLRNQFGIKRIWLAGSWVSSKPSPGDYDYIISTKNENAAVQGFVSNALSDRALDQLFSGHFFTDDGKLGISRFKAVPPLDFFQFNTKLNSPVGIVEIDLENDPALK